MTISRPSDALCHWRHLSAILPNAGTFPGEVAGSMSARQLTDATWFQDHFPKMVWRYSGGMCHLQQLHMTIETTVEEAQVVASGVGYRLGAGDTLNAFFYDNARIRVDQFDSITVYLPDDPYGGPANGLTAVKNNAGFSCCYMDDIDDYTGPTKLQGLAMHEWTHGAITWFGTNNGFPMPSLDSQSLYSYPDGTSFSSVDGQEGYLSAILTGTCRVKATDELVGMDAEAWAIGTPRQNVPL